MNAETTILVNQEGSRGFLWHLQMQDSEVLNSAHTFLTPENAEADATRVLERLNTDTIETVAGGDDDTQVGDRHNRWRYRPGSFLAEKNSDGCGRYGILVLDQPAAPTAYTYFAKERARIVRLANMLLDDRLAHHETIVEEDE